ncbi:MAG TPA: hypothetical protein H9694_04730 [Firmicutes bacterium]|nr:hypothetical protein [Bacillota bacterium]
MNRLGEHGFFCGFGHANGQTLLYGSGECRTLLKCVAAGLGAALALLGAGFFLGKRRR